MGKQFIQNRVLSVVFWLKVTFAVLTAAAGLAFLCSQVYFKHKASLVITRERARPIEIIPESPKCQFGQSPLARLEPPDGEVMVGFHLNWQIQTPQELRGIMGRNPAIINAFLQLNAQSNPVMRFGDFLWHSQEIERTNAIFQLTIEPVDIANIPDAILDDIARRCLEINTRGVPMFLRYGDWADYGVQPVTYVNGFRRMANAIRRHTNLTAMVWAPNVGINYPFNSVVPSKYPTMETDPINFRALDTNGDGILNHLDDPYGPYYPGDEYVDWVGLSVYWYPDAGTGFNGPVPDSFFVDYIRGTGPNIEFFNPITLQDGGLRNFYRRFSQERNKPMMIPETSAPYFDFITTGTRTELEIKQNWWNQLYSQETRRQFPRLKAIIHFEERKADAGSEIRDWRVLHNPAVRTAFVNDLNRMRAQSQVLLGNDMVYQCDGSITVNYEK